MPALGLGPATPPHSVVLEGDISTRGHGISWLGLESPEQGSLAKRISLCGLIQESFSLPKLKPRSQEYSGLWLMHWECPTKER